MLRPPNGDRTLLEVANAAVCIITFCSTSAATAHVYTSSCRLACLPKSRFLPTVVLISKASRPAVYSLTAP